MSILKEPGPAKLVCSIFSRSKELIAKTSKDLAEIFGEIDLESDMLAFDFTTYYEPEFGSGLVRQLVCFAGLVHQDSLPEIKYATNDLEQMTAFSGKRRVNIDPGLLTAERLVLATGKNFTHRIYLGKGVFADLTLIYQAKKFKVLPWTFPDYASAPVQNFLLKARKSFLKQREEWDNTNLQERRFISQGRQKT